MALLRDLAHETGQTMLMSTHDLDLALRTADTMWLLPHGGPLHAGAPEDLVLNGSFEKAFASEGVTFDATTGAFAMDVQLKGQVSLIGDGIYGKWTVRALQRAGYEVVDGAAPVRVEISGNVEQPSWRVVDAEGSIDCSTLHEVVSALRDRGNVV
jgi:iron complex transport system ATP-binding protein